MNKFDVLDAVSLSNLNAADKALLTQLILRANDDWHCWPSVARLCKARSVAHEKNFKKMEDYLPGLVRVEREPGRNNHYYLNVEAILALPQFEVELKATPARADNTETRPSDVGRSASKKNSPPSAIQDNPPSTAGWTPLLQQGGPPFDSRANPPSTGGTNRSLNSIDNSSENSSIEGESDDSPCDKFTDTIRIEEWEVEQGKEAGLEDRHPLIHGDAHVSRTLEREIEDVLDKVYAVYGKDIERREWNHLSDLARDTRSFRPWDANANSRVIQAGEAAEEHMKEVRRKEALEEYERRVPEAAEAK